MSRFKDLPIRKQLFVQEYLIDMNGAAAARRAGYAEGSANRQAGRLLGEADIQEAIQEHFDARSKRTEITADRVLAELGKIAFQDIRKLYNGDGQLKEICDLDDESAAAIAGIEVSEMADKEGNHIGQTKKIKLADKRAALVDCGKHLGMFVDRKEIGKPGEFEDLSDEQLDAAIEQGKEEDAFRIPGPPSEGEVSPLH